MKFAIGVVFKLCLVLGVGRVFGQVPSDFPGPIYTPLPFEFLAPRNFDVHHFNPQQSRLIALPNRFSVLDEQFFVGPLGNLFYVGKDCDLTKLTAQFKVLWSIQVCKKYVETPFYSRDQISILSFDNGNNILVGGSTNKGRVEANYHPSFFHAEFFVAKYSQEGKLIGRFEDGPSALFQGPKFLAKSADEQSFIVAGNHNNVSSFDPQKKFKVELNIDALKLVDLRLNGKRETLELKLKITKNDEEEGRQTKPLFARDLVLGKGERVKMQTKDSAMESKHAVTNLGYDPSKSNFIIPWIYKTYFSFSAAESLKQGKIELEFDINRWRKRPLNDVGNPFELVVAGAKAYLDVSKHSHLFKKIDHVVQLKGVKVESQGRDIMEIDVTLHSRNVTARADDNFSFYLGKWGLDGERLWAKSFMEGRKLGLTKKDDDSFVVLAMPKERGQLKLLEIDSEGEVLSSKSLSIQPKLFCKKAYFYESGFYVIASSTKQKVTNSVVIHFDLEGNKLWKKRLEIDVELKNKDFPQSLAIGQNGEVYVAGYAKVFIHDGTKDHFGEDAYLVQLDPKSGEQLSAEVFGSNMPDRLKTIKVGPSGEVYFSGNTKGKFIKPNGISMLESAFLGVKK